ncbi:MAG: hypothetical protein U0936_10025 [Planctomycetaceae bacterium]
MDRTECTTQLELFEVSRQQVTDYEGEGIVTDAGWLPVAKLDREPGNSRGSSQSGCRIQGRRSLSLHSAEQILRQQVYQILPVIRMETTLSCCGMIRCSRPLVGVDPRLENRPLASGSTINRFQHAFTRREAEKSRSKTAMYVLKFDEPQIERINGLNEFLDRCSEEPESRCQTSHHRS